MTCKNLGILWLARQRPRGPRGPTVRQAMTAAVRCASGFVRESRSASGGTDCEPSPVLTAFLGTERGALYRLCLLTSNADGTHMALVTLRDAHIGFGNRIGP